MKTSKILARHLTGGVLLNGEAFGEIVSVVNGVPRPHGKRIWRVRGMQMLLAEVDLSLRRIGRRFFVLRPTIGYEQ